MFTTLRRILGIGERRRHPRRAGVRIEIGGAEVEVLDWSPGGFRASSLSAPVPERGSYVEGNVHAGRVSGPYKAYVIAVYEGGVIGARFDEIDSKVFRALAERRL